MKQKFAKLPRTELNNLLSNDKGIETLLSEFLKQKSMEQAPFQIKTKCMKLGDLRPMKNEEVKIFTEKLMPHVNFDNVNISALAKNGRVVDQGLGPIIQKNMIEHFGERVPNSEAYILDKKINPRKD